MSTTAETYINSIRDQIPDRVVNNSGVEQPQSDGALFTATSLVRWIDRATKVTAQKLGFVVEDWYAVAATANQPFYPLDAKWNNVHQAFANQWQLAWLDESRTFFPSVPVGRSIYYGAHKTTDHLQLNFYPIPDRDDPTTTANGALSASSVTVNISSTANFLSYGFAAIDYGLSTEEIIQYQKVATPNALGVVTRGVCGTTAQAHSSGATVKHLGIWIKGSRQPLDVTTYNSIIELPSAVQYAIELWVLARCRRAENDDQSAQSLLQEYTMEVERLKADPTWQGKAQGRQIPGYGTAIQGPLAWGKVILPCLLTVFAWQL